MPKMTVLHVNAIIALGLLAAMFVATAWMFQQVLLNVTALGCTGTEFGMGLIAIMIADVGAVAFVVKLFASQRSNGPADQDTG